MAIRCRVGTGLFERLHEPLGDEAWLVGGVIDIAGRGHGGLCYRL
jgi:hypothetical protein